MSLIKCHECGNEVSTEAKTCPKCGAKVKSQRSIGKMLALVFFGLIFLSVIMESTKTPEQIAAEQKAAAEPPHPKYDCQYAWEGLYKASLNDPSSLEWDRGNASLGVYGKKKIPVVAVPYRAKNAFGALILKTAICEIDTKTKKVVRVIE